MTTLETSIVASGTESFRLLKTCSSMESRTRQTGRHTCLTYLNSMSSGSTCQMHRLAEVMNRRRRLRLAKFSRKIHSELWFQVIGRQNETSEHLFMELLHVTLPFSSSLLPSMLATPNASESTLESAVCPGTSATLKFESENATNWSTRCLESPRIHVSVSPIRSNLKQTSDTETVHGKSLFWNGFSWICNSRTTTRWWEERHDFSGIAHSRHRLSRSCWPHRRLRNPSPCLELPDP